MSVRGKLLMGVLGLWVGSCAPMGPNYVKPEVVADPRYKEEGVWRYARPADGVPRGEWWRVFGDGELDRLEAMAAEGNPGLRAAMLRVEQARLVIRGAQVELLPDANVRPSADWRGDSGNLRRSRGDIAFFGATWNQFRVPLEASWELDFWGRVRREVEAAGADAGAAAALGEAARLALQADVAQSYFALRTVEAEMVILRETVALRERATGLVRDRFRSGAISELDVARAETETADAQAELAVLEQRRAGLVNMMATLAGRRATSFELKLAPLAGTPPQVPAGVPAEVLQRRPDVAEAERRLAAASARIGAAKAAFFPSVRLTGRLAVESSMTDDLFTKGSKAWAAGSSVNFPIFEQALNAVVYDGRKLQFEERLAEYEQTALRAFQEVESQLSALRYLAEQEAAQLRAVEASGRAAQLSAERFRAGAVSFLEVVDADRSRLQSLRQSRQTAGQRYVATVLLIRALGGGW
jgi:multidrug efflux system outer membrane protein